MHPTGIIAPEVRPAEVDVAPQISHVTSKIGGQSGPSIPIQRTGVHVVKPAIELEPVVAQKAIQSTGLGTSEEKHESAKQEEPRIEPQQEKKSDEITRTIGEEAAQAGDKRKADELAAPKVAAGTEDQETKKLKTSNDTAATVDSNKQPEKAKPVEKKARGPKKEKKVPRSGTAARKTRSQGAAPDAAGL